MHRFRLDHPVPTGWTHIVVNYDTEGIDLYHNGSFVARGTQRMQPLMGAYASVIDDGIRASLGSYVDGYRIDSIRYGSFDIDEVVLFNRNLSQDDITLLAGKLR